mgnify:CR=1
MSSDTIGTGDGKSGFCCFAVHLIRRGNIETVDAAEVRHRNIECITVQGAAIDDFIAIFREMYDLRRCQAVVQVIDFQISKVADEKVMVFHSYHLRFQQSAVRCGHGRRHTILCIKNIALMRIGAHIADITVIGNPDAAVIMGTLSEKCTLSVIVPKSCGCEAA